MKTLTEKIIDKLNDELIVFNNPADPDGLAAFNNGVKRAIIIIKEEEIAANFDEVARIVMKHLANPEKYHPHHRVIIDSTNAELLEGKQSTGQVMDYITD